MARLSAADVRDVAGARAAALAESDWETVRAQLHPDFVYVNAQGIRIGRDEYVAFLSSGPLKWAEQRLDDVRVVVAGDVGVLTATVHDDVWVDGERHELVFVTTQTYVRESGRVLYLAGHTAARAED
jgi:ketosteroid isomerase-like protein